KFVLYEKGGFTKLRQRLRLSANPPAAASCNKAPDTRFIEHELGDRARDFRIAHQSKLAVVEDEPLSLDTHCKDGMVLARESIGENDNLHVALGYAGSQQRGIFDDRVIFTIALTGPQRLERSAPVVENAPLRLVGYGTDGEIHGAVDEAHLGAAV